MIKISLINFIRSIVHSNCRKSKDKTIPLKPYKDGKYKVSKHAVERMNDRNITKGDVHYNLYTKPVRVTEIKYDDLGRPSYERYSKNKINTRINPNNNNVTTVSKYHTKELKKYLKEKGKRYEKVFKRSR